MRHPLQQPGFLALHCWQLAKACGRVLWIGPELWLALLLLLLLLLR
jgi:hypothetical protein